MSQHHILSVRAYLLVFAALLALLLVTIGAAYLELGRLGLLVALAIASTKAVLIMLYFMHLRFSNRLTWVFAGAAFLWLGILLALSLTDYLSRGWLDVPGK